MRARVSQFCCQAQQLLQGLYCPQDRAGTGSLSRAETKLVGNMIRGPVGIALLFSLSVARAGEVMPWLCLERCGDSVPADLQNVASMAAGKLLTAASYEVGVRRTVVFLACWWTASSIHRRGMWISLDLAHDGCPDSVVAHYCRRLIWATVGRL